ncbi:MAG: hypothetical protein K6T83_03355 [Alicyclobacillus sp.]|nr:hypothetical protein [Alicyclobacillus sp.]
MKEKPDKPEKRADRPERKVNNTRHDLWVGLATPLIVNLGLAIVVHSALVFGWVEQWVYVIPLALILQWRGRVRMAQGIWLMAGAYTLINLALCGYILSTVKF